MNSRDSLLYDTPLITDVLITEKSAIFVFQILIFGGQKANEINCFIIGIMEQLLVAVPIRNLTRVSNMKIYYRSVDLSKVVLCWLNFVFMLFNDVFTNRLARKTKPYSS